jgi:hypothetical protein
MANWSALHSMRAIPEELLIGPFSSATAQALGVTSRMLQGARFVRIFPRVWRHRDHEMTEDDWIRGAVLTLPPHARLTGITRIQQLGLHYGPRRPIRFVVEGDLHLAPPEIFLHRTKRMPPADEHAVTPAAAYIAYCAKARVIDAIKVGDWLLHRNHITVVEVRSLALAELWRDGAHEAIWVLEHLDPRARSVKESETRSVLVFAGLPRPEVNVPVPVGRNVELIGDLVLRHWCVVVEYEGSQHQTDRAQYVADVDRYAMFRRSTIRYVQVTHEKLAYPRMVVGEVYRELVDAGYDGPAPDFGDRWASLFGRLSVAVGRADYCKRSAVSRQPRSA